MEGNGKVSVIIPTYNRARYVAQAVDSVLEQSYDNYEIIIVDDGSTDDTQKTLEPYMDRIRYIYQEHSGVSAARNRGIRESKGQYTAFLDSDDLWLPKKLESQIKFVGDDHTITFHSVKWFVDNAEEEHLLKRCECVRWPRVSGDSYIEDPMLEIALGSYLQLGTLLCLKSTFIEIGFFDETLTAGEDTEWFSRAAMEVRFRYFETPYLKIRYHRCQTKLETKDSVLSLIKVAEKIKERTKNSHWPAYIAANKYLATKVSHLANLTALENRKLESFALTLRAFALNPRKISRLVKAILLLIGWRPKA